MILDDKDDFISYADWIEAGYSNYDGVNGKPHTGKYSQWHQCFECWLVDPDRHILPPECSLAAQAKRELERTDRFR